MSQTHRFSLLDDSWIEVLRADGTVAELSIREAFAESDEVVELLGESPTQAFATLRLLLAILHRAIDGPADLEDWTDLYRARALPQQAISTYLDQHQSRFDLFHPQTPFYQVADLNSAKGEVSGLEKLIADVPTSGQLFTGRSGQALARVSFPEVARWLVQVQGYDVSGIKTGAVGDPRVKGGKGYPIGTGHAGALGGVYVVGENLTETLLLNLVSEKEFGTPVWEREPHTASPEGHAEVLRAPTGITDLYTWQSRRIRLVPDDAGVTGVILSNGDRILAHETYQLEPMTMWRRSPIQEKKLKKALVYFPRTHDPQKAIWRSAEALLPRRGSGNGSDFDQPGVLRHLQIQIDEGLLAEDTRIKIRAVGMQYGTQNAVTTEVVDDTLSFQAATIMDGKLELRALVSGAVEAATEACKAVGLFAADLARAAGGDDIARVARRDTARENAYHEIDKGFREWLAELGPDTDPVDSRSGWQRQTRIQLHRLADRLVETAPLSAYTGRTDGEGRVTNIATSMRRFRSRLNKALPAAKPNQSEPEEVAA